ncbi:hypothetical protein QBC44DRAFT_307638 [Cladorrhinum sp. PSN332]|nr:hypothetical protein QBC44DRAFT_307638 [Cladorrhinum sp. PSN332]
MFTFDCAICLDTFTVDEDRDSCYWRSTLPCGHQHCNDCLQSYFIHASSVTVPFEPIICCSPAVRLPVRFLQRRLKLSSYEAAEYRSKMAELDAKTKLYCSDPKCSAFIPKAMRGKKTAKCRNCSRMTCVKCLEQSHPNSPCLGLDADFLLLIDGTKLQGGELDDHIRRLSLLAVQDAAGPRGKEAAKALPLLQKIACQQKFNSLAEEQGWKACPSCKRWTEKVEGCNHMQCGFAPYQVYVRHGTCAM